jgi:hypothetical protein
MSEPLTHWEVLHLLEQVERDEVWLLPLGVVDHCATYQTLGGWRLGVNVTGDDDRWGGIARVTDPDGQTVSWDEMMRDACAWGTVTGYWPPEAVARERYGLVA